jgi:VIT1/CCC1 family predicted Fe2+/Mn2+ transporter
LRPRRHERHNLDQLGWLRAAVLGANDGIVSTSSLLLGVAAAHANHASLLISGAAGLAAGAMSMATGEYVSVHSQADSEQVALAQERAELRDDYAGEKRELTEIYARRGVERDLAGKVAEQLMKHDALGSHARDELGLSVHTQPRPIQAALASAASFSVGAAVPLVVAVLASPTHMMLSIALTSLVCLCGLGSWSAQVAGANVLRGAIRVTFWSALAMVVTSAVGAAFGAL